MEKSLTAAMEARQNKALDKLYNFSGYGIGTYRERIDKGHYVRGKVADVPRVKWNRTKYNRMNYSEQEEYDAKMKETKKEYRLYYDERVFVDVPKLVYDYYLEKQEKIS